MLTDYGYNNMVMPVSPMYTGVGGYGNGFFGDNGYCMLLLFLIILMNGGNWGNNNILPYIANQSSGCCCNPVQAGFDQQSLMNGIAGVSNQVNCVDKSICSATANVTAAMNNGFSNAEISNNARQQGLTNALHNMEMTNLQCCCDNKAQIADLKYIISTENCADRNAISEATKDILNNQNMQAQATQAMFTAGIQSIKDEFCNDRLARKDEIIADLRQQINTRDRDASNAAQTAAILAGQQTRAYEVEQYINPTPRPCYVVANPNCCYNQPVVYNNGCGGCSGVA